MVRTPSPLTQQNMMITSGSPFEIGQHCHLRYIGMTDFKMDKERKNMVRNYIDCLTSANLNEYLVALGFKYEKKFIF
jgi:hypothetical protein